MAASIDVVVKTGSSLTFTKLIVTVVFVVFPLTESVNARVKSTSPPSTSSCETARVVLRTPSTTSNNALSLARATLIDRPSGSVIDKVALRVSSSLTSILSWPTVGSSSTSPIENSKFSICDLPAASDTFIDKSTVFAVS